ncbi:hypothetical protein P3W85_28660, partial [Cupriavidus basilensis]|nr:hypothetical protein [Cupriavidus basilensis]
RKPVAETNCRVSVSNHRKMRQVTAALGLDEDQLPTMARLRASAPARMLPSALRSAVKSVLVAPIESRTRKVQQAATPRFASIKQKMQQAAEAQMEHFSTLGLDLGYVYRSAAICDNGAVAPVAANPVLEVALSLTPGARWPHFRVQGARASGTAAATSHDLLDPGHFLLAGLGCHGQRCVELAAQASQRLGVPVHGVDLDAVVHRDDLPRLHAWNGGRPDIAVLVRPDGHIAWRHASAAGMQLGDVLGPLCTVLQIPVPGPLPVPSGESPPSGARTGMCAS